MTKWKKRWKEVEIRCLLFIIVSFCIVDGSEYPQVLPAHMAVGELLGAAATSRVPAVEDDGQLLREADAAVHPLLVPLLQFFVPPLDRGHLLRQGFNPLTKKTVTGLLYLQLPAEETLLVVVFARLRRVSFGGVSDTATDVGEGRRHLSLGEESRPVAGCFGGMAIRRGRLHWDE